MSKQTTVLASLITPRLNYLIYAFALSAVAIISANLASADIKPDIKKLKIEPLEVAATPLASFHRGGGSEIEGGKLKWLGGIALTSPHPNFGGLSGLVLSNDGRRFVSVSDSGSWIAGSIRYKGNVPTGITDAVIGPLLTREGAALKRGRDRDAEAIALYSGNLDGGAFLIAFEQNARIARYDYSSAAGMSAARDFLELPQQAKKMRRNSGFEAMTVMAGGGSKGSVLAFAERMRDLVRNHVGWIWQSGKARQIVITDIGDFDIADVAALDDGSVIVLERRFRWLEGMNIRLRRFSEAELLSGRPASGEVLLEAGLMSEIDNMEGLAVSRGAAGETILTLISDDNFNRVLQRTVLLQFALTHERRESSKPEDKQKARP